MTVDTFGDLPPEPPELVPAGLEPIARGVHLLTDCQGDFSDKMRRYAKMPCSITQTCLEKSATQLMETLESSLTVVAESPDNPSDKAELMTGIIIQNYKARKKYANQYFDLEVPEEGEEEREVFVKDVITLLDSYSNNPTNLVTHLMTEISEDFNNDLNEIVYSAESTHKGRMVLVGKIIGRHVMRAVETAGGVVAGMWIYEQF